MAVSRLRSGQWLVVIGVRAAVDVPLAVPAHPSYAGMTLFAQALVLDAGAPGSVAMSRGFRAVFSR